MEGEMVFSIPISIGESGIQPIQILIASPIEWVVGVQQFIVPPSGIARQ